GLTLRLLHRVGGRRLLRDHGDASPPLGQVHRQTRVDPEAQRVVRCRARVVVELDRLESDTHESYLPGSASPLHCARPRDGSQGFTAHQSWCRCSAGAGPASPPAAARFRAVLTRQTWENAWGTLPSWRPASGSYSSASRPTS